ncbi:lysosomal alpha-mannosidase-like isoform X2 [Periplaneta americana]|uniref:lysosomal alpha-mannosidase-like isoform X2 n=1 Tax=Periplaneta americana TaxID=6978 RepID=UPI0037E971BB
MRIWFVLTSLCLVVTESFFIPLEDDFLVKAYSTREKKDTPTCGYESCPKPQPDKINVHLVAHTHDDVGWLKTVDQYYYGSKTKIQRAGVQYIIDSVVKELLQDPQKRFVYVETAFWWKWWMKQHDSLRHKVKKLVNNGQLEFIGGGWSMNDEATTNYQATIDQLTWGFRKLNESFGKCGQPRVGWQIDPFGHSREMASIFARMGFDGLLFGRLDYQDKLNRLVTKTTEMVWQGSASLGKAAELFTSVLFNTYSPPPGFCFDVLCTDEPFIDDKKSPDYNVDKLVSRFVEYVQTQSKFYTTNNILLTMGGDFTYQDAHMWYANLDKLIRYVNAANSSINVFYSTPSCYLKAVHDARKTWTTKLDDFFPYASDPHTYWSGYFTSRPTLKRFERLGNNYLQVCKQLYSLADLGPKDWVDLNKMREAMGIMQHHDAVTGTEKQKVAFDYARILHEGFQECDIITQTAIKKMIGKKSEIPIEDTAPQEPEKSTIDEPERTSADPEPTNTGPKPTREDAAPLKSCLLLNISLCDVSENSKQFVVTVYNPLSRPVSHFVRLPVSGQSYTVQDPTGKNIPIQMVPIPQPVQKVPGRVSPATMSLVFYAADVPPLGFRSYYVSKNNHIHRIKQYKAHMGKDITLGTLDFNALLDGNTGLFKSMSINGAEFGVSQSFYYYKGYIGNNEEFANRSSGAYIFRPNGSEAILINSQPKFVVYKGELVDEVHLTFADWVSESVRFYKAKEPFSEMEWMVGPIPIHDGVGKEVITRFSSNMQTKELFYTDSNGREMLQRRRNYRPTWSVKINEPVAGNYYPVTSRVALRDANMEFSVLTDRSQGASSVTDGEVELMVHRRLLHDDAFGVGEALNETAFGRGLVAIGKHWLTAGSLTDGSAAQKARSRQQQALMSPWLFFSPADDISFAQWAASYKMEYSGLKEALPENVQILTLEPWKAHTFLLRLEHIYEKNEHPVLSKPVTVNVSNLFKPFSIVSARETTLGANKWLSETQRLEWQSESNEVTFTLESDSESEDLSLEEEAPLIVSLNPMQIRTFVIDIQDTMQ